MGSPYHFTAKAVSFGKGQSAVHTAAYNAREKLEREATGEATKDYSRMGGVLFSGIFAPKDAPAWATEREQLWNRAEQAERRRDGQPARNLEMAIPHQLNQQQREWLVKDFVREQFVRKGMVADVNIHAPHPGRDERNFHAHILLTMREIDGNDFAAKKNRDWNRREHLEHWRERWADMGARALERAGHQLEADRWRHGHQTLPQQRAAALERGDLDFAREIDREPTKHRGPQIDAMERRGIETERGDLGRLIDGASVFAVGVGERAEFSATSREELSGIARELGEITRELKGMERTPEIAALLAGAIGTASRVLDYAGEAAGRAIEGLADMFGASEPTREQIAARVEARGQAAEQREIDWQRFKKDAAYAEQVLKQQETADAAERQQRQYYDRQKRGDRER